jgi:uncharacterized protein
VLDEVDRGEVGRELDAANTSPQHAAIGEDGLLPSGAVMPAKPSLQPLAADERIEAMDVLRGWALLGILLMNIEAFAGPLVEAMSGLDPDLAGIDRIVDAAIYLLVQGKFYLLFSLLFGMGFAVMLSRAGAAGRAFGAVYLRRTLALMAIGVVHLVLIWSGDILTAYALLALPMLLFFRDASVERLVGWSIILQLASAMLTVLVAVLAQRALQDPAMAANMQQASRHDADALLAAIRAERLALGSGDYAAAVAYRWSEASGIWMFLIFTGGQILGMFLLGAAFVHSGAIAQPHRFAGLYAGLRRIALPLGAVATLASFALVPSMDLGRTDAVATVAQVLNMIGAPLMALGYLAWLLRGLESPLRRALQWVAPAGRMALTNYLGQSVVCTLVFYHYGLGYFERLPRAWQVPFAIALFAVQVLLSRWWLAHFRFGPLEWLWRAATYLRWPPMRRASAVRDAR